MIWVAAVGWILAAAGWYLFLRIATSNEWRYR